MNFGVNEKVSSVTLYFIWMSDKEKEPIDLKVDTSSLIPVESFPNLDSRCKDSNSYFIHLPIKNF